MDEASRVRESATFAESVLGLRCLALAVVAGSATFLPAEVSRPLLATGILAGAMLALFQYFAARHGAPHLGEWLIIPNVGVWTLLVHAAGAQDSPLFVGYLFELPLAGALSPRRGTALAAMAGTAAYLAYAAVIDSPLQTAAAATVCGFIAVAAVLTWLVMGALARQREEIDASRRALAGRAQGLAEELQLLGDYMTGALVGIDESGRIASINAAGLLMFGQEGCSPLGSAWQEALRPDPESCRRISVTLSKGEPVRGATMVLQGADGRALTLQAEMWLSPAPRGRRAYLLLDARAPRGSDDPVRRLGEAAACVAHQIKNSIHALQGYVADLERQHPGSDLGGSTGQQYLRALRSLGALSEDVLAMAGVSRTKPTPVRVDEVLGSALLLLRRDQVPIRTSFPPEPLCVHASRSQLLHALFNLLDNATRVSPRGSPVEVRATRSDERVFIEIVDEGPGLPEKLLEAEGPVASREGSGLGLIAARRFVEASGGQLSLRPGEKGGTCVRVELRWAPSAAAQTVDV